MRIVKIENTDTIKPFDCGDEDLNGFLTDDARYYREQMLAYTYILEDDDYTIAFFSLLNDKVSQTEVSKNLWRKLRKEIPHEKHFSSYPALKIGRLGVSTAHRGEGIGSDMISFIIQMILNTQANVSACRFLTVDAYKEAVPFYLKNNFKRLVNEADEENVHTVPLYCDLKEVTELMKGE